MLLSTPFCSFGFTYDNWGANPSTTPGTSVIPGASNVEGSWTQIASSSNIADDIYWTHFRITDGGTSAAAKGHLLDLGVDPAGGTSYTEVIANIVCGMSGNDGNPQPHFLFPLFIKSGSSVAVRVQGSNATAGTLRVSARFYGDPSRPEMM